MKPSAKIAQGFDTQCSRSRARGERWKASSQEGGDDLDLRDGPARCDDQEAGDRQARQAGCLYHARALVAKNTPEELASVDAFLGR